MDNQTTKYYSIKCAGCGATIRVQFNYDPNSDCDTEKQACFRYLYKTYLEHIVGTHKELIDMHEDGLHPAHKSSGFYDRLSSEMLRAVKRM